MDNKTTVAKLKESINKFHGERNWHKYHKPKDLLLALQEELGELSECYLWVSEDEIDKIYKDPDKFIKIKEELADVFIYLITLANGIGVDISDIIEDKLKKCAIKYPVVENNEKHTNKLLR